MYEEELEFLRRHEDPDDSTNLKRVRLTETEIAALVTEFPDLPKDYLAYLQEVGWGAFRECQFAVFEPISYLEDSASDAGPDVEERRYLAFGHNFSGDTSVFDTQEHFRVAEYWHQSRQFHSMRQAFRDYIRSCMLIDADGNDEREA
jgi:hypothetical protein